LGFWFSESVLLKFMASLSLDRGGCCSCGSVFGDAKEGCLFIGDQGVDRGSCCSCGSVFGDAKEGCLFIGDKGVRP
jgi:hypothetical protein